MSLTKRRDVAASLNISDTKLATYEHEGLVSPIGIEGELFYTTKDRVKVEIAIVGERLGFSLFEVKRLIAWVRVTNGSS